MNVSVFILHILYYFDMIMPKPPVKLDDIRENLRGTHQLSEPRFGKAFRPLHEFLHGIPVEQGVLSQKQLLGVPNLENLIHMVYYCNGLLIYRQKLL